MVAFTGRDGGKSSFLYSFLTLEDKGMKRKINSIIVLAMIAVIMAGEPGISALAKTYTGVLEENTLEEMSDNSVSLPGTPVSSCLMQVC